MNKSDIDPTALSPFTVGFLVYLASFWNAEGRTLMSNCVLRTPLDPTALSPFTVGFLVYLASFCKETLRHEIIDYAISQVIEPYKEVTNRLILVINEEAYRRKERLVESLLKLVE